jgi:L-lactate dehydrogenase complex protein LldE
MLVDIFIPCFIDQFFPNTGLNMVKVLEKLGVDVHYNGNQTCCGKMAFTAGYWDEAKEMGEKFIRDFPNDRPIVGPSASCAGMVKSYYPWLFHNTAYHYEYKQLRKNIYEFSDFLVNVLKVEELPVSFPHVVTYHDSCSALREYGLKDEPRKLLSLVKDLELREMKDTDVCCGAGGTMAVRFEAIASSMAMQKVQNAIETGAEYIVSTDATCLMHQQAYIDRNNLPMKTIHLVDLLATGW